MIHILPVKSTSSARLNGKIDFKALFFNGSVRKFHFFSNYFRVMVNTEKQEVEAPRSQRGRITGNPRTSQELKCPEYDPSLQDCPHVDGSLSCPLFRSLIQAGGTGELGHGTYILDAKRKQAQGLSVFKVLKNKRKKTSNGCNRSARQQAAATREMVLCIEADFLLKQLNLTLQFRLLGLLKTNRIRSKSFPLCVTWTISFIINH